jgi:hypothetical protein
MTVETYLHKPTVTAVITQYTFDITSQTSCFSLLLWFISRRLQYFSIPSNSRGLVEALSQSLSGWTEANLENSQWRYRWSGRDSIWVPPEYNSLALSLGKLIRYKPSVIAVIMLWPFDITSQINRYCVHRTANIWHNVKTSCDCNQYALNIRRNLINQLWTQSKPQNQVLNTVIMQLSFHVISEAICDQPSCNEHVTPSSECIHHTVVFSYNLRRHLWSAIL